VEVVGDVDVVGDVELVGEVGPCPVPVPLSRFSPQPAAPTAVRAPSAATSAATAKVRIVTARTLLFSP
jgi:hypothetical protein